MSESKIDIRPDPGGVYISLRQSTIGWPLALSELCDNSFDADANEIYIRFVSNGHLVIEDNGRGCDNAKRMLTLGDHYAQKTTKLGRWGVGLKEAACWLWGSTKITTVSKQKKVSVKVDWEHISKTNDTVIVQSESILSGEDKRGTKIEFIKHKRKKPAFDGLVSKLSYRFFPALLSGKKIHIMNGIEKTTVSSWEPPEMTDVVNDYFEINGKSVNIVAGIVPAGIKNTKCGFSYVTGHRVVKEHSGFGAMESDYSRICGIVTLGDGWSLSKNKTDITDDTEDQDALEVGIFRRCVFMLQKAEKQVDIIGLKEMENEVNETLTRMTGGENKKTKKEKRKSPKNKTGVVTPINSGKRRLRAKRLQDGATLDEAIMSSGGGIKMQWSDFDDDTVGSFDLYSLTVRLNKDSPYCSQLRKEGNKEAIVQLALFIFADAVSRSDPCGRPLLPGIITEGTTAEVFTRITRDRSVEKMKDMSQETAS